MILSVMGMASVFLPWASKGGTIVAGTDKGRDGLVAIVFFGFVLLICVLSGLRERFSLKTLVPVCAMGIFCAGIALYNMSNFENPMVEIRIGLYLILGTAVGIIGTGIGLHQSN